MIVHDGTDYLNYASFGAVLDNLMDAREMEKVEAMITACFDSADYKEGRAAFQEKRKPQFQGWDDPQDRYKMPTLESVEKSE